MQSQEWFTFHADGLSGKELSRFEAVVRANNREFQKEVCLSTALLRKLADLARDHHESAPVALLMDFTDGDADTSYPDAIVHLRFKPVRYDNKCWEVANQGTQAYIAALSNVRANAPEPPSEASSWLKDYLNSESESLSRFSAWVQDLAWPRPWNYLLTVSANPMHASGLRGAALAIYSRELPQDLRVLTYVLRSAGLAAYHLDAALTFDDFWAFADPSHWGHGISDDCENGSLSSGAVFAREAIRMFSLEGIEPIETGVLSNSSHPCLEAAYESMKGCWASVNGEPGYPIRLGTVALLLSLVAKKCGLPMQVAIDPCWAKFPLLRGSELSDRATHDATRRSVLEQVYELFLACNDDGRCNHMVVDTSNGCCLRAYFKAKAEGSADELRERLRAHRAAIIGAVGSCERVLHRTSLALCRFELLSGLDVVIHSSGEWNCKPGTLEVAVTSEQFVLSFNSVET